MKPYRRRRRSAAWVRALVLAAFLALAVALLVPVHPRSTCKTSVAFGDVADQPEACFATGAAVEFDDGIAVAVPEEGEWVEAYLNVIGDGEPLQASIYHAHDDSIVAVYGDEVAGLAEAVEEALEVEMPALQSAEDKAEEISDSGQPTPELDMVSNDYSPNAKCASDAQYTISSSGAFTGNIDYYYNSSGEPAGYSSSKYRARMEGAVEAWQNLENSCNIKSALPNITTSYRGQTRESPGIDSDVTCASQPGVNTLGWNAWGKNNILGATCRWSSTRFAIAFNSSYSWYAGASLSGCSGERFDLGAVATHELGHMLGLGNYDSYNQVMKSKTWYCQSYDRHLGRGDIRGVKALYGTQ